MNIEIESIKLEKSFNDIKLYIEIDGKEYEIIKVQNMKNFSYYLISNSLLEIINKNE